MEFVTIQDTHTRCMPVNMLPLTSETSNSGCIFPQKYWRESDRHFHHVGETRSSSQAPLLPTIANEAPLTSFHGHLGTALVQSLETDVSKWNRHMSLAVPWHARFLGNADLKARLSLKVFVVRNIFQGQETQSKPQKYPSTDLEKLHFIHMDIDLTSLPHLWPTWAGPVNAPLLPVPNPDHAHCPRPAGAARPVCGPQRTHLEESTAPDLHCT